MPSPFSDTVEQGMTAMRSNVKKESNERTFPRRLEGGTIERNTTQLGAGIGASSSSFSRFGSRARRDELLNPLPSINRSSDSRSTLSSSEIHLPRVPLPPLRSSQIRPGLGNQDNDKKIKEDGINVREPNRNRGRFTSPTACQPQPQPMLQIRKSLVLPPSTSRQISPSSSLPRKETGFRAIPLPHLSQVPNTSARQLFNSTLHCEKSRVDQSFESLVRNVLHHRMFPLIFKGVHETSVGSPPIIMNRRCEEAIRRTTEESEAIEAMARQEGVSGASRNIEAIDMFFAVLNAAFKALQSADQPPIPAPLHSMITACERVSEESRTANSDASSNPQPWEAQNNNTNNNNDSPVVRPKLSDEARRILEVWFNEHFENPYPTDVEKRELARQCGLQLNQINNFFGNKRMRLKRKALEDRNKSGPADPNQPPYEASVLPPRSKWRAIVLPKKNGNEAVRMLGAEVDSHDELVSGLFQDSDNHNKF